MILIIWRMLAGSERERRRERLFAHKVAAAGLNSDVDSMDYEAVQLRLCNRPCEGALQLREQSFLLAEAPKLPLPDCDRTCLCGLDRISDRRVRRDRRHPVVDAVELDGIVHPKDGRAGRDRRRSRSKVEPYAGIY